MGEWDDDGSDQPGDPLDQDHPGSQKPKKKPKVLFHAVVYKVSTTVDGGWRVTLDVPECDSTQVMVLSHLRNMVLDVGVESNE